MKKGELPDSTFVHKSLKLSTNKKDKIREIEKYGIAAQGRAELIAHLSGKRLTRDRAIRAFCYYCAGWFQDGKFDCKQSDCPLYPFMPYSPAINAPVAPAQALPAKNAHAPDRLYPPNLQNALLGEVR